MSVVFLTTVPGKGGDRTVKIGRRGLSHKGQAQVSIEGPGTICGGLPVIAKVWFTQGDGWSDPDAGVDAIYWQRRDGTKGKEIPQKVYDRAEAMDYGLSNLIEQVFDHVAHEQWLAKKIQSDAERQHQLVKGAALAAGIAHQVYTQRNHRQLTI